MEAPFDIALPVPKPSLGRSMSTRKRAKAPRLSFPSPTPSVTPEAPQTGSPPTIIDDSVIYTSDSDSVDWPESSKDSYGVRSKELMSLERDLRDLGADMYIDMPRVTVIGGQSAGKSSLVEAVSGISVPRDSGICTRCPMELTMESLDAGATWSCEISLRIKYDTRGKDLPSSRTESFGSIITDKSSIELWLRRAQAAILSPHRSASSFYEKSVHDLHDLMKTDPDVLQFSRNVIVVKLMDPEVIDLSFVDLPGLIQNAEPHLIKLVENLVVERIKGENNLILVAIPMNDDMENQLAVRLAREEDARGVRTIGVLTKPDMLSAGASSARNRWRELILGNSSKHNLNLGYYCVRLIDEDERLEGVSQEDAQRRATEFFENTPPWNDMLLERGNRFGIPAFVMQVNHLLVQMIEANLPKMRSTVQFLLAQSEKEQGKLPIPPSRNAITEVMMMIKDFCDDVTQAMFGRRFKSFAQENRICYDEFKHAILATCPDFRPFGNSSVIPEPEYRAQDSTNGNPYAHLVPPPLSSVSSPIDLTAVRAVITESVTWELPGHVPFDATERLIGEVTCNWKSPTFECFRKVLEKLSALLQNLVKKHFNQFHRLESLVKSIAFDDLNIARTVAESRLHEALAVETGQPVYTQNYADLEREKSHWLTAYQPSFGSKMASSKSQYQEEIQIMATVRAYYQVAHKRFIDVVPLTIEHQLNQPLAKGISQSLIEKITGGDLSSETMQERMEGMLSEDPKVASRRQFLKERICRLREISDRLAQLGNGRE